LLNPKEDSEYKYTSSNFQRKDILAMAKDFAPGIDSWILFEEPETAQSIAPDGGEIPGWLRGTYYVNGPARFQRGGQRYRHWLDGDGMVRALRFDSSGAHFTSRYVRTRKLQQEEAAGKAIYRTFGTGFPGDILRRNVMLEPPVNVSVYPIGGRLLAFAEQSIPFELDPETLETLAEFDFGGRLNEVSPFAAHAKFDPVSGNMVNFGISFSTANPVLYLYEFSPDGELLGRRRFPVEAPHTNHDFAITGNYAAFFLSPLELDFGRFWNEGASVMEALEWRPEKGSYILIVPRVGCDRAPVKIKLEGGHSLHLINAFEAGDRFVLDIVEYRRPVYPEYQPVPDFYQDVDRGRPVRYVIDLSTGQLIGRKEMTYDRAPDFPSVIPSSVGAEYEDFWMLGISSAGSAGRKFFDQLVRGSWNSKSVDDVYKARPGCYFGGEPVFVGKPGIENEGMIIIQEYDSKADRVAFLLVPAFDLKGGPAVRLPLEQKTHPGFHAAFSPDW
jgi:all-trans-8'-apo-beta-carotenal 15,15'-oxygenase